MKSGEIDYEILRIREFGKAMHPRNVEVRVLSYSPSEDSLKKLAESFWSQHGQDVEKLTTVFCLSETNLQSAAA